MAAMALTARLNRRGGAGTRWITIGVVVTLLVLLIDASLKSRSPGPVKEMDAGAWVDRVLPIVADSTAQGNEIQAIWTNGLTMSGGEIAAQLQKVATDAQKDYKTVSEMRPPDQLAGANGLLEASLLSRSQAAATLEKAFKATLGSAVNTEAIYTSPSTSSTTVASGQGHGSTSTSTSPSTLPPVGAPPSQETGAIVSAGSEIQVGDQAYAMFLQTFPASVGVHMPTSVWASNLGPYQENHSKIFLASLQSHVDPNPVYKVGILSVSFTPSPVKKNHALLVIPETPNFSVTIILANTGNQAENNLTVTGTVQTSTVAAANAHSGKSTSTTVASGGGTVTISTAHQTASVVPGQYYTVEGLGPLSIARGIPANLVLTIQPPVGSAMPVVTDTVPFEISPAVPPPTTTTTVPSGSGSSSTSSTSSATTSTTTTPAGP